MLEVERRGERDSNSRVRGTVDFKSTAIPGYAISACIVGGAILSRIYPWLFFTAIGDNR